MNTQLFFINVEHDYNNLNTVNQIGVSFLLTPFLIFIMILLFSLFFNFYKSYKSFKYIFKFLKKCFHETLSINLDIYCTLYILELN